MKKRKFHTLTEEHKKNIGNASRGHKLSEEAKLKISLSRLGKKTSEETREKQKLAKVGFKHSEATKLKMSKTRKGKPLSDIHKLHLCVKKPSLQGKHSWNWGKRSPFVPLIYSDIWDETLRRSIRERDNYTCRSCLRQQGDRAFSVHHIDYNKFNCDPINLVTLCNSCHQKTNFNKKHWINYFKNI